MPDEDGYSLIRRIRTTIDAKSLPAAALSAYVDEESRRMALEAGFQEYLPKPVEPARLVSTLAKLAHHNAR
jgi:CheY-like chemotaxis protein